MKTKSNDLIMQKKVFGLIALATAAILSLPYLAMQYQASLPTPVSVTDRVDWKLGDFIVMGTLLFSAGSIFVLAARRTPKNRLAIGIMVTLAVLWLWAELAVGVFTNWGS